VKQMAALRDKRNLEYIEMEKNNEISSASENK
jgi:hypothetical protein